VAAAAAAAAAVPATISGFKASAHYTLARFMPKTTAPRPGATPAGTHKGETFWAVADLEACHTETKWRRRGFVLRPGAVQAPAARIEESRFKGAYYGPWQVQGIEDGQPLPLDGAVPGRHPEYGSVEAPPLSVLPPGTVHLQGVGVAAAAKSLGVDAAPALVGFEQVAGGRWVPQTRGVVVLAAHAAAVRGAASQAAAIAIARAAARKRATAFTAWRRVLAEALSWVRVRAEHGRGGGGVDEGKVEGEEGEEAGAAAAAAAATAPLSIAGVDVEMI
jgi:xeroderma pigmentosum group C-complementing protein